MFKIEKVKNMIVCTDDGEPVMVLDKAAITTKLSPDTIPDEIEELCQIFMSPEVATFTCNVKPIDILSLCYGRKITNNWLKMHGCVMRRKIK